MSRCKTRSCNKSRSGYSNYCSNHKAKRSRNGHPLQNVIRPHEYAKERKRVSYFIENYKEGSIALQSGLREIERLLKSPESIYQDVLRVSFYDLHEREVTPEQVLTELTAIYLFSEMYPSKLINDECLDHAYGRAVCRLGGCSIGSTYDFEKSRTTAIYKRYSGKQVNALGKFLRQRYAILLVNIRLGIEQHYKKAVMEVKKLKKPIINIKKEIIHE